MYEEDLMTLRDQREALRNALGSTITEEQRERLQRLDKEISEEMKYANAMTRSWLLEDTRVL